VPSQQTNKSEAVNNYNFCNMAKGGRVRIKQHGPKGGGAAALNPMADLAIPPEEMIHLPPKHDPNTTHVWPMTQTFSLDYKRFTTIYPTYLDSKKSTKQGRRIAIADAVEKPFVTDISEVLQKFNIRHVIQPFKGYPRDIESRWDNPGRVLVDMNDGVPLKLGLALQFDENSDSDDEIPILDMEEDDLKVTKKQLCREIAKRLPGIASRIQRLAEEKRKAEDAKEAQRKKNVKAPPKRRNGKKKK